MYKKIYYFVCTLQWSFVTFDMKKKKTTTMGLSRGVCLTNVIDGAN